MGLSWGGQRDKLEANASRFNRTDIRTVGADGRVREMTCIPLRRYPMWLATINPAKVPDPAVRQRVELYQDASAEALYQFWATGSATVETVPCPDDVARRRVEGRRRLSIERRWQLDGLRLSRGAWLWLGRLGAAPRLHRVDGATA